MTEDKDQVIKDLKAKLHSQRVVIDTLRGMLFTAWNLTNNYEDDDE